MNDPFIKNSLADYTEIQFIRFIQEVFAANNNGTSDEALAKLLDQFCRLSGHPDGTDLIYYPESEEHCNPENITETVKKWRASNGLPGFKPHL